MEGFLVAPGYIDLSKLRFFTVGTGDFVVDDDEFTEGTDDVYDVANQDDDSLNKGGGRNRRQLDQKDFDMEGSAIDIAVFNLVRTCVEIKERQSFWLLLLDWCPHYINHVTLNFSCVAFGLFQFSNGMRLDQLGYWCENTRRSPTILLQQ